MNILVVGNGFDIAHDLPTSYKDFLHFTDAFMEFKTKRKVLNAQIPVKEDKKEKQLVKYLIALFNNAETDDDIQQLVSEIDELITDNKWMEHFKNINIAQGWVDFEREIAQVIRVFDELRNQVLAKQQIDNMGVHLNPYQKTVLEPFIGQASLITSTETIDNMKNKLLNDLNKLTRCLEIYLIDYVEKITIEKKLPDIEELDINRIVSFNYTNIYVMNYATNSSQVICDFIHGEAKLENTIDTCNMVIGIDEYLVGSDKEKNLEFIQFKKFFQRIYKATGSNYINWLNELKPRPTEHYFPKESNIYIYGHSLDPTDKDILAKLITSKNVKTTIFYHNQEALEKQIINLVSVITEDELIYRTGTKNIIFKKTKNA